MRERRRCRLEGEKAERVLEAGMGGGAGFDGLDDDRIRIVGDEACRLPIVKKDAAASSVPASKGLNGLEVDGLGKGSGVPLAEAGPSAAAKGRFLDDPCCGIL